MNAVSAPASSNSSATLKWRYKLDGNVIWPSIAIGAEGSVVYLTSKSGALYAINTASGNLRWRYQAGSAIESSPVIDDAGVVYFGSYDGKVYGVSAEGNLAFRFATGGRVQSTPAIGSDRVLYVGSDDNKLYAVPLPTYSDSNIVHQPAALWSHRTPGDIASSPLVGEQVVIIDSYSNALTALHSSSHGLLASSPWPRFRGNNQGESSYDPTFAGEILWSAQTLGVIPSSPALSPDGSQVAVGSYDNSLYVYDVPSGEQLWSYDTGSVIMSSPSYSRDGQVVYVANYTGTLFALTAPSAGSSNGVLLWQYQMGDNTGYANPAVDSNGNIYIGSRDRYLHVVDASGKLIWRYRVSSSITSSIAVDERDGTVYFASGLYLYAVSAPDSSSSSGRLKWRYQTDGFPSNSPAIGDGGSVVYIGSRKGYLYAINSIDGSLRWQQRASSSGIDSSPVIDDAGVAYYGSDDGNVYGLDPQGQLVFKFAAGDRVESTPAIGSDRVLYFGSKDKQLYAVPLPTYGSDAALHQPEALWSYDTGGAIQSSPVVGDEVVIVGSYRKSLSAIQSSSDGLLAASPWPKFKGNNPGWSTYKSTDGVGTASNQSPTARISVSPDPDTNEISTRTSVSLSGAASSDPNGDFLTYTWSQPSGQSIDLSSPNSFSTTFTAATPGTYTFTLTVSDGELTDSAVVTLDIAQANRAPTARISVSPDPETTTLTTVTQVTLDGSASSDPDGDELSHNWSQPSNQDINLSSTTDINAAFIATTPGTYTFTLTVNDGEFADSAIVKLDITQANRAPTARISVSPDPETNTLNTETQVILSGSASSDPDGDELSHNWSQPPNQNIALSAINSTNTIFTAATAGTYTFTLTVSDGELTDNAEIAVVVDPYLLPDDFRATAASTQASLNWTPYSDSTTYNIYRSTNSDCDLDNYQTACTDSTLFTNKSSGFVDTGLTNTATYYYWLEASLGSVTQRSTSPISAALPTGVLNDTGIDWGGDYPDGNNADCSSSIGATQDCDHGRDATHDDDSDGHAGFSFTKLDSNGNALDASATDWSCVQDNVTGLIWEVKTDDGGLRDADDRYNWYNTDPTTNGGTSGYADYDGDICYGYDASDSDTYCNTEAFAARVNAVGLCGANDWRLPDIEELRSIVDYSRYGPSIDTDYFPNTPSGVYWSASPFAYNSNLVWLLAFLYGYDGDYSRDAKFRVRLVRVGQ